MLNKVAVSGLVLSLAALNLEALCPVAAPHAREALPYRAPLPLSFRPVECDLSAELLSSAEIASILQQEEVGGGTAFLYRPLGDEELVCAGYEQDGIRYALGVVGRQPYEYGLRREEFSGRVLVRYEGWLGANLANWSLFSPTNAAPRPFLRLQGVIMTVDLDGDGVREWIVQRGSGTATETWLYRWQDDHVERADLNAVLGAEAVLPVYRNMHTPPLFSARVQGESKVYVYAKQGLIEVEV